MDYEKLGSFYLGKIYDLEEKKILDDLVLYDSKDLTTHALCVGMTGSGKTGLCVSLLEEALIDGIPALILDPKGDIGNLLLTFPELRAQDFEPYIDPQLALQNGKSVEELAQEKATLWRNGLEKWHQNGDRIRKLKESGNIRIFTPGASSGLPLALLASLVAPDESVLQNEELLVDKVSGVVGSLLSLLGDYDDSEVAREGILLNQILLQEWKKSQSLSLEDLIFKVQNPPFEKLGVLDLESFFPKKERFNFSLKLNNLLISPSIQQWRMGESLDISKLLYGPEGKPNVNIISLSHLDEKESMFVVTLVLNELNVWMQHQSGTSGLRALLYMDEIFGYFPPVANPPSKKPMLNLLKKARAFGLGIVLATQNPSDLDYKGLSNIGTWFVGRLQTERDKERLLVGLETVTSGSKGVNSNSAAMDKVLSQLGERVFLLHNVHEEEPIIFHTRWVLSFLRGPLNVEHISRLMEPYKNKLKTENSHSSNTQNDLDSRMVLPPEIKQCFRHVCTDVGMSQKYKPYLHAELSINFKDTKSKIDTWKKISFLLALDDSNLVWQNGDFINGLLSDLSPKPKDNILFQSLPKEACRPAFYKKAQEDLLLYLLSEYSLKVYFCKELKEYSTVDEGEDAFLGRLKLLLREKRDQLIEGLRQKYDKRLETLMVRAERAEDKVEKEAEQYQSQKMNTMVDFGMTLLGAFLGRKTLTRQNISKAQSTFRSARKTSMEKGDLSRAQEYLAQVKGQIHDLEMDLQVEIDKLHDQYTLESLDLEQIKIGPKKNGIEILHFALLWQL